MIYDTLDHLEQYQGLSPRLDRALELLRTIDFSSLEDGQYEVEGRDLFYSLQSYESKPTNPTPEAHRDYIDIQFLVEGAEKIGVAPLADMTEEVEGHPERDIWFYHGPVEEITLTKNRFAVFFPNDAHAPGVAPEQPAHCRKFLIKVHV